MEKLVSELVQERLGQHPLSIQRLQGGYWSIAYRVDLPSLRVVIKIQQGPLVDLQKELEIVEKLSVVGVKTPLPIECGPLPTGDLNYLVMTYVEGELLETVWRTLPERTRTELSHHILDMLQKLNSVVIAGYGFVGSGLQARFATLKEYIMDKVANFSNSSARSEVEDHVWDTLVTALYKRAEQYASPCSNLVHADFRMRNLIYDTREVTLIDFGNALGLLPAFDYYRFIRADHSDVLLSDREITDMTREYVTRNPAYEFEKAMCQALVGMELASFSAMTGKRRRVRGYIDDMVQAQRQLETNQHLGELGSH